MKIKTKIIIANAGLVILCVTILASIIETMQKQTLSAKISQIADLQVENIYSDVDAFVNSPVDTIKASMNFMSVADVRDRKKIEQFFKETTKGEENYSMLYYANARPMNNGGFVYNDRDWTPDISYDATSRDWFQTAITSAEPTFCDPYVDAATGNVVVSIAQPFSRNKKFQGVVALDMKMDFITGEVENSKLSAHGQSFMINRRGYYVTNPDPSKISKDNFWDDFGFSEYKSQMRNDGNLLMLNTSSGMYFVGRKMPDVTGWYFVTIGPSSELFSEVTKTTFVEAGLAQVCIILSIIVSVFIAMGITKPINTIGSSLEVIASGNADLTKRLDIKAHDEVGHVADGFNSFVEKLQTIIGQVKKSKDTLNLADQDLLASTEDTSTSITQIISSINEVQNQIVTQSGSVEQTAGAVNEIASNIQSLEKMIENQSESVSQASAAVEQMIGNINSVNVSVDKMASSFDALQADAQNGTIKQKAVNERISEIENQSKTLQEANAAIASIARETNLLAMNAAIEAAHAGQAGKGFSVVADEIRKLSETSSAQSKTIGDQLKLIQNSINTVVQASSESSAVFISVSEKIGETDQIVRQIKNAMEEQQAGSRQITDALSGMNDSTAEVRTASSEMSEGNKAILEEVKELQNATEEMKSSISNMSSGATKIDETGKALTGISEQMSSAISDIGNEIDQFKV